jgi:hypothetical protein
MSQFGHDQKTGGMRRESDRQRLEGNLVFRVISDASGILWSRNSGFGKNFGRLSSKFP